MAKKTEDEAAIKEAEEIKKQAALDADYKVKHKVIAKVENTDDKGNKIVCYFKEPSRMAFSYALSMADSDPVQMCQILFNDAVVKEISDWELFFNDNKLFYSLINPLQGLATVKKSTFMTL